MRAKIIGEYNTRPKSSGSNTHVMDRDYIVVLDTGFVIILAKDVGETNGASIPLWAQLFFGGPRSGFNRSWSAIHDGLYNGTALCFDVRGYTFKDACLMAACWRTTLRHERFAMEQWPTRKWSDRVMRSVMHSLGESCFKRLAVYRAVRIGGALAWWKSRKSRA